MIVDMYAVAYRGDTSEGFYGAGMAVVVAHSYDDAIFQVTEALEDRGMDVNVRKVKMLVSNVSGYERGIVTSEDYFE